METIIIKTQKQLNALPSNFDVYTILEIRAKDKIIINKLWENSHAVLCGNSHAELRGNSHAVLWENSHAVLWENSHAVLWENSHAVLWENSHAELRGNSHAELRGNSHAELSGNSHAVLCGNSHAVLCGNSHAVLWENSHAELRGNSHAVLCGNSHAVLWENSHAVLWDFSVIHKMSNKIKIKQKSIASQIISVNYPNDIKKWCALRGIKIKHNRIQLWKCVNKNGHDFYSEKINYDTKKEIAAPDWDSEYQAECGHGLHLADSPSAARLFVSFEYLKTARLFKVSANINDCVCYPGLPSYPMKLRARACRKVKEYPINYHDID